MAKDRFSDEIRETIVRLYNHGKGKEIKDLAIEYGSPKIHQELMKLIA